MNLRNIVLRGKEEKEPIYIKSIKTHKPTPVFRSPSSSIERDSGLSECVHLCTSTVSLFILLLHLSFSVKVFFK